MKKILLLLLVIGSMIPIAVQANDDIRLQSFNMYHNVPTNEIDYYARVNNAGSVDHEDLKVRVVLPEMGTYARSRYFTVPAEGSQTKLLIGDAGMYPYNGWVTVRIAVSNDNFRKVYYRELLVRNGELIY